MKNTWDYIERVRAEYIRRERPDDGQCSNYRIALLLGISQASISLYKSGARHGDDVTAAKIADYLRLPHAQVIADLALERAVNEGNDYMAKVWAGVVATFAAPLIQMPPRVAGGATASAAPAETKKRRTAVAGRRSVSIELDGGDGRNRTADLGVMNPSL